MNAARRSVTTANVINQSFATASHTGSASYEGRANNSRSNAYWANFWFSKLCQFHHVKPDSNWDFTTDQVIAFLRYQLKERKYPAWKRLKIAQGLILHRRNDGLDIPSSLLSVETKLKEFAARDRGVDGGETHHASDEEIVGPIDPSEIEPLQLMRQKLRLTGRAWNTEKTYIKWLKRFCKSRGLATMEDLKGVDRKDVEAFLTDLVVDGNVAASTQDVAFFAIHFFFRNVLEREIGDVNALRSSKPKLCPTVLSRKEVRKSAGSIVREAPVDYRPFVWLWYADQRGAAFAGEGF